MFLANQKIKTAQKGRKHWLDAFWRIKRKKYYVSHENSIVLL